MSQIAQEYNICDKTVSDINTGKIWYDEQYQYPLRISTKNPHYFETDEYKNSKKYCKICDKELKSGNITGYCSKCIYDNKELKKKIYSAFKNIKIPTKEEYKYNLRKYSWALLQEKYKVSYNRLHNWCDLYNLPKLRAEINSYSMEEWENL